MLHEGLEPQEIERAQAFSPGQAFAEMAGTLPLTQYRADVIDYQDFSDVFS